MTIFEKKREVDKYDRMTTKVQKGIRLDMDAAQDIDEMQDVCSAELGKTVSQNILLSGIISSFISDIKETAKVDEDLAVKKLCGIVENERIRRYYENAEMPYKFVWK